MTIAQYAVYFKLVSSIIICLVIFELIKSDTIATLSLFSIPKLNLALPVLFILAIPNISYYLIWNYSKQYVYFVKKVSNKHPVNFLFEWVKINKFFQFSTYLVWYWNVIETSFSERLFEIVSLRYMSLTHLVCGIYIFVLGLIIYFSVWAKLGVNGVCYGYKLGQPVKWVTGFPFNLGLRHPLYIGLTLIIMGLAVILIDKASAENGILLLSLIWSSYNISTGQTEEQSDKDKKHNK